MRIGVITQWYPPENVWVPKALVDGLRAQGHEVTVVTGAPHYPTGTVAEGYRADRFRIETIDGVTVHRVPEFPYRGTGIVGRLAGYASFALAASIRAVTSLGSMDAVVVYDSPATAALPAMVLRTLRHVPFVLQVQDIWPDSVIDAGFVHGSAKLRAIRATLDAFVSASYRMSSHVTVITPSAVDLLASRGVPRDKLSLVYNWIDDPAREPEPEGITPLRVRIGAGDDDRVFLYAGAMGPPQDLGHLVDGLVAADLGSSTHLVLMGPGVEHNALAERAAGLPTVHVLDPVPISEANALLRQATAGIVSLADTPLHRATFPSKVQGMCALGVPVLAVAPGDVGRFVVEHGAGVAVSPGSIAELALAFRSLAAAGRGEIERVAARSRAAYEAEFTESIGGARLSAALTASRQS